MRNTLLNIVGLGGLVLLGVGLWQMWPPLSFVIIGVLMFMVAIYGILRREE